MKKLIFILILVALVGGLVLYIQGSKTSVSDAVKETTSDLSSQVGLTTPTSTQSPVPNTAPTRLTIDAIGVDAPIESVGMNAKGEMAVPREDMNVAWYNLGYKPGENGSAVIAGHFDTRTGAPAVFYNLSDLQVGDEITVTYPNGTEYTFSVTESAQYPYDSFPLERVFNTKGAPTLNLITCDGVFNRAAKNYSLRRVVYASLKE